MKKVLSILCASVMMICCVACGDKTESEQSESINKTAQAWTYNCLYENDYFSLKYPCEWTKTKASSDIEQQEINLHLFDDMFIRCYVMGPYSEYQGMTNEEYVASESGEDGDTFTNKNGITFVDALNLDESTECFTCLNATYLLNFKFSGFSQDDREIIEDFLDTVLINETTGSETEKPTEPTTVKQTEKATEALTEPATEPATDPVPTTEPITEPPTNSPTESKNADVLYQTILDEYTVKIKDAVPGLVDEYNQEAANNSAGINGLAEIYNAKIEKLAEISNEGIEKMAEIYLDYGSGQYNEYEEWSGKLMDVYMEESETLTDAYMNSVSY